MRSRRVEMVAILPERAPQMIVVQDQNMVQAVSPNAAKEALANCIAVRRSRGRLDDDRAATRRHCIKRGAKLGVVIPNQEPRAVLEWHRFAELLCGPLVRWVAGDVEMDDLTVIESNQEQCKYGSESEVVELKKIAGPSLLRVVLKKGAPRLPMGVAGPDAARVLLDSSPCLRGNPA